MGDLPRPLSWQRQESLGHTCRECLLQRSYLGETPRSRGGTGQGPPEPCQGRAHADCGSRDLRQEVTRAGRWALALGPSRGLAELQEHFLSDPPSRLPLLWLGRVCVLRPIPGTGSLFLPAQHTRPPLLPPPCLLPQRLPVQPPRKVLYFSDDPGTVVPEPAVPCALQASLATAPGGRAQEPKARGVDSPSSEDPTPSPLAIMEEETEAKTGPGQEGEACGEVLLQERPRRCTHHLCPAEL